MTLSSGTSSPKGGAVVAGAKKGASFTSGIVAIGDKVAGADVITSGITNGAPATGDGVRTAGIVGASVAGDGMLKGSFLSMLSSDITKEWVSR